MKRKFLVTVDIDPKLEPDRIERLAPTIQYAINDCMNLKAKVRMLPIEDKVDLPQSHIIKKMVLDKNNHHYTNTPIKK